MMKNILFVIGLCLSVISCDSQKKAYDQINIPNLIDNKIDLQLSDVFSEVTYTTLDSNKDIFISRVNGLIIDDDFILILDNDFQKLLQFNSDGSFVGEFMSKGRGPGEFFEIGSIDINSRSELLIHRNGLFLDIMKPDGSLINSIKFDKSPVMARWLSQKVIALFYPCPSCLLNDGFEVSFINLEGEILKRALKHSAENNERRRGTRIRSGRNGGTLYYWRHNCDTVYTINKSLEVYPRYIFEHDNRHIPVEKYSQPNFQPNLDGKYTVESYSEWGDYIFIFVAYNRYITRGLVNHKLNLSGNVISDYNKWTVPGLFNDIDGGMPFWAGSTQNDGSLVNALDPMTLKETYEHNRRINPDIVSNKNTQLLDSIINQLNMMSNPVLMRVR